VDPTPSSTGSPPTRPPSAAGGDLATTAVTPRTSTGQRQPIAQLPLDCAFRLVSDVTTSLMFCVGRVFCALCCAVLCCAVLSEQAAAPRVVP